MVWYASYAHYALYFFLMRNPMQLIKKWGEWNVIELLARSSCFIKDSYITVGWFQFFFHLNQYFTYSVLTFCALSYYFVSLSARISPSCQLLTRQKFMGLEWPNFFQYKILDYCRAYDAFWWVYISAATNMENRRCLLPAILVYTLRGNLLRISFTVSRPHRHEWSQCSYARSSDNVMILVEMERKMDLNFLYAYQRFWREETVTYSK